MVDSDPGTVDVTNLVESLRESFVSWGVAYIYAQELATPVLGAIVALPIISTLNNQAITAILNLITKSSIMASFFLNTAIRKASQAQDYVDAVTALKALPPTTSEADYATAEQAQIQAFNNFVTLGN